MNICSLILEKWVGVALDGTGVVTFVADGSAAKHSGLRTGAHLLRANGKDLTNSGLEDIMEFLQVKATLPLRLVFSLPIEGSKVVSTALSSRTSKVNSAVRSKPIKRSSSSVKSHKRKHIESNSFQKPEPYKLRRVCNQSSQTGDSHSRSIRVDSKRMNVMDYSVLPSIGKIPPQVLQSLSRHQTWTCDRNAKVIAQSSILTLASPQIDEVHTRNNYKEFFNIFDKDRDGFISCGEMKDILKKMKYHVKNCEIQELFAQMKRQAGKRLPSRSASRTGELRISFDDFYAFAVSRPRKLNVRNEISWREFQRLDEDRDGFITSDQLVRFMRGLFKLNSGETTKLREFLGSQGISPEDRVDYETYDSIMRSCM